MKPSYKLRLLACLAVVLLLLPMLASAAPFTPGNIVVARVGDGSSALNGDATAVFLDEYTPAGVLVQTIDLPTSVSATNRILTASGVATSELNLTRSADGRYLVLTGYSAAPGTPAIATTPSTDVARVIGRIAADGTLNTATSAGDAFSGTNIRSATTADGSAFYVVGGNSGVRYVPFGGVSNTPLNTAPTNIRYIDTIEGNLYISASSSPNIGISQLGTGLPTTAGQPVATLPGFPGTAAGASPYAFYFADLSTTVPGADVVYVADDRTNGSGGIQKWSLVAGSWVLNGTIGGSATAALRGLNGRISGAVVALVASGNGGLFLVSDNAGYNVAPSTAALPSPIATAAANTAFRGLAFAPVTLAPLIAGFTPTSGGPGTTVTITGANFTGTTAVSIGGFAVPSFTVVSATSITFVVPAGTGSVSGFIRVAAPGGTVTSATAFNVVSATMTSQAMPGLGVYPNPATDRLIVVLPQGGAATVALRDLAGRLVLAPATLGVDQPLHLPAGLAAGIYLLEVQQGSVVAVRRVAKQ